LQKCLKSDKFDAKKLCIIGTMDIWITTSNYSPIFTNGNNTKYKTNKRKINI